MSIQKISYIIILSLGLLPIASCNRIKNKIKSIEYSMHEGAIYIDMGVDTFYWEVGNRDIERIPLIKPYALQRPRGDDSWMLALPNELYSNWDNKITNDTIRVFIDNTARTFPIKNINVKDIYIYGFKDNIKLGDVYISAFYFIINTKENQIKTYSTDRWKDFLTELNSLDITLNTAEDWVDPDILFDDFKIDPILPWFPENIKSQLKKVKMKIKEYKG